MAIANGLIYINAGQNLLVLDEATGKVLRTISPKNQGKGLSGPVISGGMVYWVSGAYINAWHVPGSSVTPSN
jgi:hypothetical protein